MASAAEQTRCAEAAKDALRDWRDEKSEDLMGALWNHMREWNDPRLRTDTFQKAAKLFRKVVSIKPNPASG